jgi:hypothetical protein
VSPQANKHTQDSITDTNHISRKTLHSTLLLDDTLGKLVHQCVAEASQYPTIQDYLQACRSKGDLQPNLHQLPHPAAKLLQQIQSFGAVIQMTSPPWTDQKKQETVKRGPHRSAYEHVDFLREEFSDMVRKKFWTVLPLARVIDHPELRLSPLGIVPQHERRPRIICDYSFYGVNEDTVPTGPHQAMRFGRTLNRIMTQIVRANPKFGPVLLGKYDLADGYYRLPLNTNQAMHLACLFPESPGEESLVAIPLVLPMGWTESPPYFCAATETIIDLTNSSFDEAPKHPPHRLEHHITYGENNAKQLPTLPIPHHRYSQFYDKPLANTDVYIDDIIGLYQPSSMPVPQFIRHIFHNVDRVFRPVDSKDTTPRSEPISVKKLLKGDGDLATRKVILGWIIDTHQFTLELTKRRLQRLLELLHELPRSRKRISTKTWQKVLGELRSMAPALAGSRGLFGPLQKALASNNNRVNLTADAHDFLDDFRWLAKNLHDRPTRLFELVPAPPQVIGTTDASGIGLGGIFFVPTAQATPSEPSYHSYVWRYRLPEDISARLLSEANPKGSITNSDLELAAAVVHPDVIASQYDISETTVATLHDNTPTVFWQKRGSTTTTGPAAYLLRWHALHTRQLRYISLHDYIPGPRNTMADNASRLFDLSFEEILTHFNSVYPQPLPWIGCTPRPETISNVITALCRKRSEPESLHPGPTKPPILGNCGWTSALHTTSTHGSPPRQIHSRISKCSDRGIEKADSPPATTPCELARLLTPSEWWDKHTSNWGPGISDWIDSPANLTSASNDNYERSRNKTQPRHVSNPSRSNSSNIS